MTSTDEQKFHPHKWRVFLVVAVGVFLSTLDSSMVNIALPRIMDTFKSSLRATEWVVAGYLLTITSTLLLWGCLSDRIGRRRIYTNGLLIFGGGSLLCSQASLLEFLIVARFIQAIGAAMMMATGPAIIRDVFPSEQLGRALGLIGVAVSLGLMSGPVVGGMLIQFFSWRSLFFFSVPIAFAFAIAARMFIPEGSRADGKLVADWPGALVWAGGLAILVLSLSHASSPEWSGIVLVGGLCVATAMLILFMRIERFSLQPLLPIELVRQRYFWSAVVCAVLSFKMLFTVIMLLPFYLARILALPPFMIGLTMTAIPLAVMVAAPLAGSLSDRIGYRFLTAAGLVISAVGIVLLAFLPAGATVLGVAVRLFCVGGGQAMFLSPNSASVLVRVRRDQVAMAAALLATARNLGMLLGISLAGLLFAFVFSRFSGGLDLKDFTPAHQQAFLLAMRSTFLMAAATACVGAVVAWRR